MISVEVVINNEIMYKCPDCDKIFKSRRSCSSHMCNCKSHLERIGKLDNYNQRIKRWSEAVDPYRHDPSIIARRSEKIKGLPITDSQRKALDRTGKTHSDEWKRDASNRLKGNSYGKGLKGYKRSEENRKAISEGRKKAIQEGRLVIKGGENRGHPNYIRGVRLRSRYESVVYLLLLFLNIEFEYESKRVFFEDHTYLSDFYYNDIILEVKGWKSAKVSKLIKAWKSNGYNIKVIYTKEINKIWDYLKKYISEDELLDLWNKIAEYHKSDRYLEWDYIDGHIKILN